MSCAEFRRMSNAATFSCGGLAAEDSDLNLAAVEGLLALDEIEQLVSQVRRACARTLAAAKRAPLQSPRLCA
jgi:hypothetical protein